MQRDYVRTLNGGGSCGDIVINGGTVNATGAAAGIGGASGGDNPGDVTMAESTMGRHPRNTIIFCC